MGEKKRILLVDDELDIAKLVVFRLQKAGYDVISIDSGKGAFKLLNHKPDLILLDILLPDIDGYTLCKTIKSNPDYKDIPVILFTASATELGKLDQKIKELDAQDYIIKPFDPEELLSKIKKYI